jgi:protocatechuate 3,4-dioxygenase beta subunit
MQAAIVRGCAKIGGETMTLTLLRSICFATFGMVLLAEANNPRVAWAAAVDEGVKKGQATETAESAAMLRIAGRVVDEKGRGISAIHIQATAGNTRLSTDSAANGQFELDVPKGLTSVLSLRAVLDEGARQAFYQITDVEHLPPPIRLVLRPARRIAMKVIDAQQKPVAGAWVAAMAYWYDVMDEAMTDESGETVLRVPADANLQYVIAGKSGIGLDYYVYRRPGDVVNDPYKLPPDHRDKLTLLLSGTRSVGIRVVDEQGQPLADVPVTPWYFQTPKKGDILNIGGVPWFRVVTDAQGRAVFDTVPADNVSKVVFWARRDDRILAKRVVFDPQIDEGELTATLLSRVLVKGRVTFADGQPAPGAEVDVAGYGYQIDSFSESVRAGKDGAFEVRVYPDQFCLFAAKLDRQASEGASRVVRLGQPVDDVNLVLQSAARVHGRLTIRREARRGASIGSEPRPLADQRIMLYMHRDDDEYLQLPVADQLPNLDGDNKSITPRITRHASTNQQGEFEFLVGPGHYYLFGPQGVEPPKFVVIDQAEVEVNLHAERPASVPFTGRVVLESEPKQVVKEARVSGIALHPGSGFLQAVSGDDGSFRVQRAPSAMFLYARSADERLGAIVPLAALDTDVVIPLAPTASAEGRLIDETCGPLPKRRIDVWLQVSSARTYCGTTTTNAQGKFQIHGIVPIWDYYIEVAAERKERGGETQKAAAEKVFRTQTAEPIDLGDIEVSTKPRAAPQE